MRLFLLIACLCEFVFAVAAQTGTVPQASSAGGYRIAGTVVSKTDGHALIHARVSLRDVSDVQKIQSLLTAED